MTDEAVTADEQSSAELAPAPTAKVFYSGEHEKLVPLEWPIEFDGKVYNEIRVHRVSGKEVRDHLEALSLAGTRWATREASYNGQRLATRC